MGNKLGVTLGHLGPPMGTSFEFWSPRNGTATVLSRAMDTYCDFPRHLIVLLKAAIPGLCFIFCMLSKMTGVVEAWPLVFLLLSQL